MLLEATTDGAIGLAHWPRQSQKQLRFAGNSLFSSADVDISKARLRFGDSTVAVTQRSERLDR